MDGCCIWNKILHWLRYLLWQFPLRQIVIDVIQPSPLWSSSPSFPWHLHHHHSHAHIFFFSCRCMIQLQPTFLHFLGYFFHLHCPSNYFIPNAVQLGDSTYPCSLHYHVRGTKLRLLCLIHCPCIGTVHDCWSYNCFILSLDPQAYSSVIQNTRYPLPVFPSRLYYILHRRNQVYILCQCHS